MLDLRRRARSAAPRLPLIELLAGPHSDRRAGTGSAQHPHRGREDPELAYCVCPGPADTTLGQLIPVAAGPWRIGACLQAATGGAGLASCQVWDYTAWYRHVTLAMLAHAYVSAPCHRSRRRPAGGERASSSR